MGHMTLTGVALRHARRAARQAGRIGALEPCPASTISPSGHAIFQRLFHDDASKRGSGPAAGEKAGEPITAKARNKDNDSAQVSADLSAVAPVATLAEQPELLELRTTDDVPIASTNEESSVPLELREGADPVPPSAVPARSVSNGSVSRDSPRTPRNLPRPPPKEDEPAKFFTGQGEEVAPPPATRPETPRRPPGRRRTTDNGDGSSSSKSGIHMPSSTSIGSFHRGAGGVNSTLASVSIPSAIASPYAIPTRTSSSTGPTSLQELLRIAGSPTSPDDIARRMIAGASVDALLDKDYPINETTWQELRALLIALTDETLTTLKVVDKLPSVSSGIVSLAAPYPGSELYLRHLAKKLAADLGADFLAVWNHDIFPRIPSTTVLQSKIEMSDSSRSAGMPGMRRASRKEPGGMILTFGGGPRGGGINLFGADQDGSDENAVAVPYPWFRNYVDSQGDMTGFYHSKNFNSQQPAYYLLDGFQSFFNTLTHTSPQGLKRPKGIQRSVLTGERLPNTLPPLIVYYEDFSDLLLRQRDEVLSEGEIVQALTQVVGNLRRQENGRNIVVLVPHTPTFFSKQKSETRPAFDPMNMFNRRRGAQGEEENEDDDEEPPSRLDDMLGRKKKRPITFDTPLDKYLGVPKVDILPPLISIPGTLTGARVNFPLFMKMMRQDLAQVITEWNEREIRLACKHAGVELPYPPSELVELVLGGMAKPSGTTKDRTGRKLFEERCLTMPEVEKVVAMAMGLRAKTVPTPLAPTPVVSSETATTTAAASEIESAVTKVKATGLLAARVHSLDSEDLGKFLRLASGSSMVKEAARLGGAGEHAEAFKDPNDRLRLDSYEERLFKDCYVPPSKMSATFASVGGIVRTKRIVQELIQLPLQRPELFSTGILKQTTTGILLFGPPGTGKTLLARAVAAEAGANFLNVQMSHLQNYYVGENEKNVRALFSLARKMSPCVIFVDEIDALLKSRRGGLLPSYAINTINEFMLSWDGLMSDNQGVIVVGCTNRPFDLDEAVLRRLPRRVMVDMPDDAERKEILEIHLKEEKLGNDAAERDSILDALAKKTEGYSGSDLRNLAIAAAMNAIREQILNQETHKTERTLHLAHFEKAIEAGDVVPSVGERTELVKELKQWDKQFGSGAGGYRGHSSIGFL